MVDATEHRRQSDSQISVRSTSTLALGGSAAAMLLKYAYDCLTHEQLLVPSFEEFTILVGLAAPVVHMIYRGFYNRLSRWAGESTQEEKTV